MDYITILGVDVEIEIIDLKDGLLGLYSHSPHPKIQLKKSLRGKELKRVLRHEAFHALLDLSGVSAAIPYNLEEQIVTCLEYHAESLAKQVAKLKLS